MHDENEFEPDAPDAADLYEEGFRGYADLCYSIGELTYVDPATVAMWIRTPIQRLRTLLTQDGYIVLPGDHSWACMYAEELIGFFTAHRFWQHEMVARRFRITAPALVNFYNAYMTGERWARAYLPERTRTKMARRPRRLRVVETTG